MNRRLGEVRKKAICKCELSDNGSDKWAINQKAPLIIISGKRWLSMSACLCSPAGAFACNKATSIQREAPLQRNQKNNINPCATETVCKHFFMLIISNMSANVKLIYPSCMEKRGEATLLLWLQTFLRSTCFSVSLTAAGHTKFQDNKNSACAW